jgi:hypothetical protein
MPSHFLFNGHARARAAIERQIREQMLAECAAALAAASFWGRVRLWREIECEVARRVNKLAPLDALY